MVLVALEAQEAPVELVALEAPVVQTAARVALVVPAAKVQETLNDLSIRLDKEWVKDHHTSSYHLLGSMVMVSIQKSCPRRSGHE